MIDGFYSQYLYTQRAEECGTRLLCPEEIDGGDLWRFFHFKQGSALSCHHKKWLRAVGGGVRWSFSTPRGPTYTPLHRHFLFYVFACVLVSS